jgi:hypothetical protein
MALKLAEFSNGRAVIESDLGGSGNWSQAIEELQSPSAKQFAIQEATKRGIAGAAVGVSGGSYPVDFDGNPIEPSETGQWPDASLIGGFRIDIPVASTFR